MFIKHYLPSIIWSFIILILCSIPGKEFPDTAFVNIPHLDKIVHFILYFILSYFIIRDFLKRNTLNINIYILTVFFVIVLGTGIEILQHYLIPFRTGEIFDMLFNVMGALLFVFLHHFYTNIISN